MKRFALLAALALALWVPGAFAQKSDHIEVGVFADYMRLHNAGDANFWGLGGRAGFNARSWLQFEGEIAYDFERTITNGFSTSPTGTITVVRSPLHLVHGTFGPKIQTGSGPFRIFAFAKGGFLNFTTGSPATLSGFTNSLTLSGDTNGVFYPGGGAEVFAGPVGLRLDVGDMMYFDNGANHNLRITFGPHFRF